MLNIHFFTSLLLFVQNNYINAQNNYTIEEVEFSLVLTDTPEDTCTSFVYKLKCSKCDKYYVGRTHYGEQECYNEITTNTTSAVYKHIQDTGHTFKIDDIQRLFSCCENNKLKILESLLIKRYIVRDIGFLNIFVMKELTLFQYSEDEIGKARSQLTVNTDRLGDARNKYTHILEFDFKEPSDNGKSACENDKKLTLLQAEFERFYDKTQIFIKDNKESKDKYISGLRYEYGRVALSHYKQPISWNKVVIGNILEYEENIPDGIVESKLDNLAIELPDIFKRSYKQMKKDIRKLLCTYMEAKYKLLKSDKPEDTKASIIYLMKCNDSDCDRKLYIGHTHVGKEKRFKEHTETDRTSAIYQHIRYNQGHGFNIEDMEILEVCCDHNKLRILESLYIKKYLIKGNKLLNKRSEEEQLALFAYTEEEGTMATEFLNN